MGVSKSCEGKELVVDDGILLFTSFLRTEFYLRHCILILCILILCRFMLFNKHYLEDSTTLGYLRLPT